MLQELERVLEEVQDLPVQVAGLAELEQGVADGRAWAVRVRTTLGMVHLYEYETSVALLRDLLTSTSKLCVECKCRCGDGFGLRRMATGWLWGFVEWAWKGLGAAQMWVHLV